MPQKKPKKVKVFSITWGWEEKIIKPKPKAKPKKKKTPPKIKWKSAGAASYNRKKK